MNKIRMIRLLYKSEGSVDFLENEVKVDICNPLCYSRGILAWLVFLPRQVGCTPA